MRTDYNENDYDARDDYEYEYEEQVVDDKAVRGYRIVIIILAVILVALSAVYFKMHQEQKADYALLEEDRTRIQGDLDSLIVSYDDLKIQNDTMAANLEEAKLLVEQLKNERRLNYNKIRAYQKEVGTLRTIMQGYVRQIDSLKNVNKKLTKENISYKKEISTAQLRAEMAEERAAELNDKVRVGSVVRARSINMVALNEKSKEVTRVKNAARLRVDFVLGGNELAEPGQRTIYACITSPEGYVLSGPEAATFTFETEKKVYSASRDVDYQNDDLDVKIFFNGSGFTAGTYKVELYSEGKLIGKTEVALR